MQSIVNDINIQKIMDIIVCYPSIKRIGIFGSYARGEQTNESDIDILYDYDESLIDDTIDCLANILDSINVGVDFVYYNNLLDVNNQYDAILKEEILHDVIWLYEH